LTRAAQLLIDGRKEYLGNDEVFKYLDLLAYGVELIVGALFFRGASIAAVLPVSSWAVLLMCFKTLSFARGFSSWGASLVCSVFNPSFA
jgi:hypothetical protein